MFLIEFSQVKKVCSRIVHIVRRYIQELSLFSVNTEYLVHYPSVYYVSVTQNPFQWGSCFLLYWTTFQNSNCVSFCTSNFGKRVLFGILIYHNNSQNKFHRTVCLVVSPLEQGCSLIFLLVVRTHVSCMCLSKLWIHYEGLTKPSLIQEIGFLPVNTLKF